ncbi:hypothetical protein Tco_0785763 [Tanacetum coccineum]
MGGYKHNQLKSKSFEEIQKMFANEIRRVNTFIPMDSEVVKRKKEIEESSKGTEDELESDKLKKVEAIDVIPLATRLPVIVDYKLHKEGLMAHYELIRADGTSKRYTSMIRLLQGINKEDLQTLWKLVKTKHGDIRPEDEHERVLWGDLKVMFEPDIKSDVWRNLQGYKVKIWKLIDSCGVHFACSFMLCDLDFEPLSLSLSSLPSCDLVSFTNILILCLILKASNQSLRKSLSLNLELS